MGGRRALPTLFVVVATMLLAWPAAGGAAPGPDEEAAERAAREISLARERANAIADELWATQSAYDLLVEEETRLVGEIEQVEAETERLRSDVEALAVSRFVSSGSGGIPVLTDVRAPNDRVRADVLVGVVVDVGATALDDFDAARTELVRLQEELSANRAASRQQQERLEQLRIDAEAEVVLLREVEQQRLEDEAVQLALEAREREERRRREEAERVAAEAARQAEAEAAAAPPTAGAGASGGDAGGRTGGGGGGSVAAPTGAGDGAGGGGGGPFVDAIACPVIGGSAYGDTWGAPRSGGRRHQGVDMLGPIGTPLAAVVSGTVEHRSNRLGGITVSLMGDNGNRYYYAHLSGYEGPPGRVTQGQVIGYMGDTGNATGVPHLHFEIRPGGGVPVNPTPSVRAAGC